MAAKDICPGCGRPLEAAGKDLPCPYCLKAFALAEETVRAETRAPGPPIPEGPRLGRYVLAEALGAGGMGEVWKAWDTDLGRWVALKFPTVVESNHARFRREAQTAGKLTHPHIAAIYELGEAEGRIYIAMQYVPGVTLDTIPREDRRTLAALLRDAARAVAHAHEQGIVHRDLKPRNLMAVSGPAGWHVYVMDFGLARPIEGGDKLSSWGAVLGTPSYMSPEQSRGGPVDGRSDVYSLGATLYELLTGRAPFQGTTFYETLARVAAEEPARPRLLDPAIDRDLETIVLKCLEKDPDRRFATAGELADDLDRWLQNEPILARPPSLAYRLRRKLARRKGATGAAAAASLAVGLLAWWFLAGAPERAHLREHREGMRLWDESRKATFGSETLDRARDRAREARARFERALAAAERPEALVMRGRCLELEGGEDDAQASFERALALDPAHPEARVELAQVLLNRAMRLRGPPRAGFTGGVARIAEPEPEGPEERRLRERAEELLRRGPAPPALEELLEGLLLVARGDYAGGAERLARHSRTETWDADAMRLEGVCRFFSRDFKGAEEALERSLRLSPRATTRMRLGEALLAQGRVDAAVEAYTAAIGIDPRLSKAWSDRGMARFTKGDLPGALADFDEAVRIDDRNAQAWLNRGATRHSMREFDAAIGDFGRALEIDPRYAAALVNRGVARKNKGDLAGAVDDYDRAIALDPRDASAHLNRGSARKLLGDADGAVADWNRALELRPGYAEALVNRAIVRRERGDLEGAIADYDEAARAAPGNPAVYYNRANARRLKKDLPGAIADYDEAIRLNPRLGHAWLNRGLVREEAGDREGAAGDFNEALRIGPPTAEAHLHRGNCRKVAGDRAGAIADFDAALGIDPRLAEALNSRGAARYEAGDLERAIRDFDLALEARPGYPEALLNRSTARRARGDARGAAADGDEALRARPDFPEAYNARALARLALGDPDGAIADCGEALRLHPRFVHAYANRGLARQEKEDYTGAIADYTEALRLDPGLAAAYLNRGTAHVGNDDHAAAIRDFEAALKLNPRLPEPWMNRGLAREGLAKREPARSRELLEGAASDYRRTLEMTPATWPHRAAVERFLHRVLEAAPRR